jgi:putative Holliday junction resolvase
MIVGISFSRLKYSWAPFLLKFKTAFPEIQVDRVDERFTSKIAFQTMIDSGLKKKQRQNKALVDEIAATIMLQDYLHYKK